MVAVTYLGSHADAVDAADVAVSLASYDARRETVLKTTSPPRHVAIGRDVTDTRRCGNRSLPLLLREASLDEAQLGPHDEG